EKINLISLLEETKTHLLADVNFHEKNIEIFIHSTANTLPLSIDPVLFKSALLNLFVNAIQAMPQGGKIDVIVHQQRNHVILTISDTGIGIPKEHVSKIFSPFFTSKSEGTGLGLAEVQKVIQAHSGSIEVQSKVGQGTTFVIKIPLNLR